jgi:hypothetical protein
VIKEEEEEEEEEEEKNILVVASVVDRPRSWILAMLLSPFEIKAR